MGGCDLGRPLIELRPRDRLLSADASCGDIGAGVVLRANGSAGEATQHRELARVRERVGNGALKEPFEGCPEWRIAGEIVVERLERAEEAGAIRVPRLAGRVAPALLSLGHRERPLEQIAHVRENLRGSATARAHTERPERRRRVAERLARAIGKGRHSMAKELARGIRCRAHYSAWSVIRGLTRAARHAGSIAAAIATIVSTRQIDASTSASCTVVSNSSDCTSGARA